MTVADNTSRNQYTATSGQTVFAYTFEIVDKDDIVVLKNGTTLSEGTDYTVSNVGNDSGGNVTLTVGATASDVLTLYRDMPYSRTQNYTNSGDFLASEVNSDFDRLWLALQQNGGDLDRVLIAPNTDPTSIDMTIPAKADREGKFLSFDSVTGNPTATSIGDVFGSGTLKAYNFVGNGSTTAFTLGSDPGVENNTQVYIDGVYQQKNGYTVSGTTLTFSAAPPNLSTIEVMVIQPTGVNATDAASVSFTQTGSNDTRTVQAKLEESVSVKDFGAVGDGVTDNTAAIQAAIDSLPAASSIADPARYGLGGGVITFPNGTYKITSPITITHNVTLQGDTQGASVIKASSNIDLIQIEYGAVSLSDYAIIAPAVRDLQLDGGGSAEAGITNRSGGTSRPVTYALFEGLQIYGCKVGIHLFGAWNNTFRRIAIRALDYNGTSDEGIIGIIGETVSSGQTYGPSGHQVTAAGGAGGFNNNIFDTIVTVYMKRMGIHVRAISNSHSYSNKFINCNFEQIIKQASPQTYAPYTDTSATPEGGSSTPLIWQGEAIGLHTLGRIAGFSIDNCYFEAINDVSAITGGIGVSFDDVGIVFGSGSSKTYENVVSNNFFNANCERTVLLGKCQYTKINNNAVLLNASGNAGYLVTAGAIDTMFNNELLGNIDSASAGAYNWLTADEGLGVNGPDRDNAFVTINSGAQTGIDIYRSGGTANFGAIRFRDGTNANTYAQLGFSGNTLRVEGTSNVQLVASGATSLTAKSTGAINFNSYSSAPAGSAGDVYYDSTTNKLRCHNGTSWNDLF